MALYFAFPVFKLTPTPSNFVFPLWSNAGHIHRQSAPAVCLILSRYGAALTAPRSPDHAVMCINALFGPTIGRQWHTVGCGRMKLARAVLGHADSKTPAPTRQQVLPLRRPARGTKAPACSCLCAYTCV